MQQYITKIQSMYILGVSPFFKQQNNGQAVKCVVCSKCLEECWHADDM